MLSCASSSSVSSSSSTVSASCSSPAARTTHATSSSSASQQSLSVSCSSAPISEKKGWGSLRPPSLKDIAPRKRHKAFDMPVKPFEYLVVLDFEWTADNTAKMLPCSEITQFPCVLVRLAGANTEMIAEFDSFVRPVFNPKLTAFSISLTAITQVDVDNAPTLDAVIPHYLQWLQTHGLLCDKGDCLGKWAVCTWSDADVGSQLVTEVKAKNMVLPPGFDSWVNLKPLYERHYGVPAKGGLQACVNRIPGLSFEGRAHNGLIDARNTAKIVVDMAKGSVLRPAFSFTRATRSIDPRTGKPFGASRRFSTPTEVANSNTSSSTQTSLTLGQNFRAPSTLSAKAQSPLLSPKFRMLPSCRVSSLPSLFGHHSAT